MRTMHLAALCGVLGLAAPPALAVQTYHPPTDVVGEDDTAAADRAYEALTEEYEAAMDAWYDELDAVQAANEAGERRKYPDPPDEAFFPRYWELAQRGQVDARLWCVSNFEFSGLPKERHTIGKLRLYFDLIDEAGKTHTEGLMRALSMEAAGWGSGLGRDLAFGLLDELAAVTGDPDIAAQVLYTKGSSLSWSDLEDADVLAAEQFELLLERYPDHELAPAAAGMIFAAENLQVGMQVPDIVGADVDGNPLKLSDHAGKVRVIGFWGFW